MGGTSEQNRDLSPRSQRRQQCAAAAEARSNTATTYSTTLATLNENSEKKSVTPEVLALLQMPKEKIERIRASLAKKVEGLTISSKFETPISLEEAIALTPSVSEHCVEDIAALELIYYSVTQMAVELNYGDVERQNIESVAARIDHKNDTIPLNNYIILIEKTCDYLLAPRNLAYIDTPDDNSDDKKTLRWWFYKSLYDELIDLKKTFDLSKINSSSSLLKWVQEKSIDFTLSNDESHSNEPIKQKLTEIKTLVRDIIEADKKDLIAFSPELTNKECRQYYPSQSNFRRILKCFACDIINGANNSAKQARYNATSLIYDAVEPTKTTKITLSQKEGRTELDLHPDTEKEVNRLLQDIKIRNGKILALDATFRLGISCPCELSPSRTKFKF